ncbi:hypothetical protein Nepgr_021881 [Nepenthes gracilis]|uniref:Uncharacterized protein n=1 Tax=Nepenthes gracilis TaxID=150966 RepID=A0AAD3XXM2_NEPGR|nr:hypothetical protein Nepgr_021881 [Nepenthes gracilis]
MIITTSQNCKSSLLTRIAHPGGAVATNKAVSVAKFLKRKLQEPGGFGSLDPELIERAVENIKETANANKGGCWT